VPVTVGERIAASIVAFLVAAMSVAYAIDRAGFAIPPFVVLAAAVTGAVLLWVGLRAGSSARRETVAFVAIVAATLAYLVWLASPSLLPLGSGPDLTHHLMLVDYVERHWRLPHDPALGPVMGEMIHYTPGFHLLAVLAGAWTRTGGFHAAYPVLALTVALKAGFVFLIAMRMLSRSTTATRRALASLPSRAPGNLGGLGGTDSSPRPQTLFAVAAVLMLFAPREYSLRSFTDHSFLAQVVSELFAVAMWWALVVWDERPSRAATIAFGIAGVGAFLTWPVWIGPLILALAMTIAVREGMPRRERLFSLAAAVAPSAIAAAVHAAGRARAAAIVGSGGFVVWPSTAIFSWWFLILASAGLCIAAMNGRTRSIVWLVASIALQAGVLVVMAKRSGADRPYLALKMVYLLIYPLSVGAALTLTYVGLAFHARLDGGAKRAALQQPSDGPTRPPSRLSRPSSPSRPSRLSSPAIVTLVALIVSRGLIKEPRHQPVVSTPMYLAGRWARANLPPGCIDYLVQDDDSAYWLHLAVLGNARQTNRAGDPRTFEPKEALIRWIQPEGLPFAIVDDINALPKDIRTSLDVMQRFGPAAVVRRRGRSVCPVENRGAR